MVSRGIGVFFKGRRNLQCDGQLLVDLMASFHFCFLVLSLFSYFHFKFQLMLLICLFYVPWFHANHNVV